MGALDLLGAEAKPATREDAQSVVLTSTLAAGMAGSLAWRAHPILGLLNGFAVGSNVSRVAVGEIPWRRAAGNLGAHVVATTGSLALPAYPAIGYVAGVVASNMFLRRDGTLLQRVDETMLGADDAPTESSTALVPVSAASQSSFRSVSSAATDLASGGVAAVKERPAWQVALAGLLFLTVGAGVYSAVRQSP